MIICKRSRGLLGVDILSPMPDGAVQEYNLTVFIINLVNPVIIAVHEKSIKPGPKGIQGGEYNNYD